VPELPPQLTKKERGISPFPPSLASEFKDYVDDSTSKGLLRSSRRAFMKEILRNPGTRWTAELLGKRTRQVTEAEEEDHGTIKVEGPRRVEDPEVGGSSPSVGAVVRGNRRARGVRGLKRVKFTRE